MRIVADENIPYVEHFFEAICYEKGSNEYGSQPSLLAQSEAKPTTLLLRSAGRNMSPDLVTDADLLLVRSITQVNQALVAGSSLKFVGSATIGTDHIDQPYLAENNITFSNAPGCNADSVAEYVTAALIQLKQNTGWDWVGKTASVIGVGNVGSRVVQRLEALGLRVLKNDPPRQQKEQRQGTCDDFVSLEQALNADLICLHTPLTTTGEHATEDLISRAQLAQIADGAVLLNAGRGPVINGPALMRHKDRLKLILDVWPTEPEVNPELLASCFIATPHIAGYSLDGKVRGTAMLADAVFQQFDLGNAPQWPQLPGGGVLTPKPEQSPQDFLQQAILTSYQPLHDDQIMREALQQQPGAETFDWLRKNYPVRREFRAFYLNLPLGPQWQALAKVAAKLGFQIDYEG
ncbi:4-phosphoerythronate dehydrogenase [Pelagibaculum spongiae]|uniref:Erythronate-4-phosphate dehydrogenase n=1 Tax=Pelagibaculum spongiae TaxID=2080658 RepID=A0A2V1GTT1_9GAMM|nr:4-phosphoerythronate dehydrogenase [Pelagibaculum spongiae]PVZ69486.1 erythronate-4-phosphate dehydrogenase [Pelagibaculum spongiae]